MFCSRLTILAGLGFFVYCVLRAYFVGIVHDEAYTFEYFIKGEFKEIISQQHTTLNNHMLNSVLVKISYMLFGAHVFFLRLPTLLLFGVYLVYTFKLLKRTLSPLLLLPSFIILCSNPFLLDFFSLARGYAGAITVMMVCLYYTGEYISGRCTSIRNLWRIAITSSLTLLFHFGMLNFFVPFAGIFMTWLFLRAIFDKDKSTTVLRKFFSLAWRPLLVYGLLAIYVIPLIIHFKEKGEFTVWMPNNGSLHDSIASLLSTASYLKYPSIGYDTWVKVSCFIFFVLMSLWTVIVLTSILFKGKIKYPPFAVFSWAIIIVITIFILLQHVLLKNDFPIERFILFAWPLLLLPLVYLFGVFYQMHSSFIFIAIICALGCVLHLVYSANFSYALTWSYDAKVKTVINRLEEIHKQYPSMDMNVGCTWKMEPQMNYYRFYKGLYWLRAFHREGFNKRQQFYYVFDEEKDSLPTSNITAIYSDPFTKATLFKNNNPDTSAPLFERDLDPKTFNSNYKGKPCLETTEWPKISIPIKNLTPNTEYIVEACLTTHINDSRIGYKLISLVIDKELKGVANCWKVMDFGIGAINGKKDWQDIYMTCYLYTSANSEDQLCALVDNYPHRKLIISGLKLKVWKR